MSVCVYVSTGEVPVARAIMGCVSITGLKQQVVLVGTHPASHRLANDFI